MQTPPCPISDIPAFVPGSYIVQRPARLTLALDAALSTAAINCGMRQTARNVLYRLSANHIDAAEATALLAPGALAEYDHLRREAMRTEAACEAQRTSLAYLNHAGSL